MKKKILTFFLSLAAFFITFYVYSQPTELLQIKDMGFSKFGSYKYPPVSFSHELHAAQYRVKCPTCHHLYKNGRNIWTEEHEVQKCSDCHGGSKVELTTAYHMRCWGCHERLREIYLKVDAPTDQCYRCHIRNIELEKIRIQQKLRKTNRKLMDAIKKLELKG
ncbi:MAG TPA: hypothetical protein ENG63_10035, partial [Candidatus Desulfofervidus auxilii]|nr:hypothetical protein [Candidatus Desulfofervidus auxilii]